MRVTIVDYDAGNIRSVANAVWRAGGEPEIACDPDSVRLAERIILPGVGAAGAALARLRERHLDEALGEVRRIGRPILGICVGMQVFADELFEFGRHRGLGWMRGRIEAIDPHGDKGVRVPHIGWAEVTFTERRTTLIGPSSRDRHFYFCHSYRLVGDEGVSVARVSYGSPFTCAVSFGSVFACQFHPEKSQLAGQRLLERFLEWRP